MDNYFKKAKDTLFKSPASLTITGFLVLIAAGTLALMLPSSSASEPLDFIQAFFTSTSASCVTGLSVIDVGSTLSFSGQIILLALIQIGGLGIMTISTMIILIARGKASLTNRNIIQDTYTGSGEHTSTQILKNVIAFTLLIQALGGLIIFSRFALDYDPGMAAYLAIFHSVSAFCNAGFSLFGSNLTPYADDIIVNLSIAGLIIAGGIGFLVITEIWTALRRKTLKFSRLSLHTKLALLSTFILIFSGTLVFLVMEWKNTLVGMPLHIKLLTSFFQSVSTRTAGFNTVNLGNLSNETISLFMLFMFIGACPGSCAGGIKTTTAATLALLGISRFRGKGHAQAFGRTIPEGSVNRSANILMLGAFIVISGTMVLFMTEATGISRISGHQGFAEIIFEVISAFGTAGMSMGITPDLSYTGKLIITAIMFTGRLGPLLMGTAISRRISSRIKFAEEDIMTG